VILRFRSNILSSVSANFVLCLVQGSQVLRSKSWRIYRCHVSFLICCHVWRLGSWNLLITCNTLSDNSGEEICFTGLITSLLQFGKRTYLGNPLWLPRAYYTIIVIMTNLPPFLDFILLIYIVLIPMSHSQVFIFWKSQSFINCSVVKLCLILLRLICNTETWGYNGDDVWRALYHYDDGTFLNLHRIYIQ
jgi:hypothetical protein